MDAALQIKPNWLHSAVRIVAPLSPDDSIRRFLNLIRFEPLQVLPVIENGRFCGLVAQEDAIALVFKSIPSAVEEALNRPISDIMTVPERVIAPSSTLAEIQELFANKRVGALPVVDEMGRLYGVVSAADLLMPELPAPRPKSIGGMATPFGVYLTDGRIQAGASNLALVASGMLLCLLSITAFGLLEGGVWITRHFAHVPLSPIFDLEYTPDASHPGIAIASIGFKLVGILLFFLLMHATRVAGYHAAEHQTVHALERNEKLSIDIVKRMPRAHPRCGTNLVAAMLMFTTLVEILQYAPRGYAEFAALAAAITTLFTWRSAGTFLQERFTTRPASNRELKSGILAGDMLMAKFLADPPCRASFFRRIWCSGMPQTFFGYLLTWSIVSGLEFLTQ